MNRPIDADLIILDGLRGGPLSAAQLSKRLLLARSSVLSALEKRKSSLASKGCVVREGARFRITDKGKDEIYRITQTEIAFTEGLAKSAGIRSPWTYGEGVSERYDHKTGETLLLSFWISRVWPVKRSNLGQGPQGEAFIEVPKILHRWLRRPAKAKSLKPPLPPGWSDLNQDYLGAVFVGLLHALTSRKTGLEVVAPPYVNDVLIIRSRHLDDVKKEEVVASLRKVLGVGPRSGGDHYGRKGRRET